MLSKTASSLSFSPDIMRGAHACALAAKGAKTSAPASPASRLPGLQPHAWSLGTLSKDDDVSSENDGKKMNLHSFKLSTFPGVEFLRILLRLKKTKGNSS